MRLDKYLASIRLLKSRSMAKTAADEAMIFINGNPAKAAAIVKPGDVIEIDIPRFYKKIKVIELPAKNMRKSEMKELFEMLEERQKELI